MKHKAGVNEGGWIQKFDAAFSSRPVFFGIECLLFEVLPHGHRVARAGLK